MELITFIAESAADAVQQVRTRLGPSAVVVNVRPLAATGRKWFGRRKASFEIIAYRPDETSPGRESPTLSRLDAISDAPAGPASDVHESPVDPNPEARFSGGSEPAGSPFHTVGPGVRGTRASVGRRMLEGGRAAGGVGNAAGQRSKGGGRTTAGAWGDSSRCLGSGIGIGSDRVDAVMASGAPIEGRDLAAPRFHWSRRRR